MRCIYEEDLLDLTKLINLRDCLIKDNKRYNYKIQAVQRDPFFMEEDNELPGVYNTVEYVEALNGLIEANKMLIPDIDEQIKKLLAKNTVQKDEEVNIISKEA